MALIPVWQREVERLTGELCRALRGDDVRYERGKAAREVKAIVDRLLVGRTRVVERPLGDVLNDRMYGVPQ